MKAKTQTWYMVTHVTLNPFRSHGSVALFQKYGSAKLHAQYTTARVVKVALNWDKGATDGTFEIVRVHEAE